MKNFDLGILFVRLGLGICLFMHGFAKILHGVGGVKGILAKAGLPEIMAYSSYTGEVVAPIMIILGYFQGSARSIARYRHEPNDNVRLSRAWKFARAYKRRRL